MAKCLAEGPISVTPNFKPRANQIKNGIKNLSKARKKNNGSEFPINFVRLLL